MIVVDTSVLVSFLRGDETAPAARLTQLERQETPFVVPAICVQELLQGARDESEWRSLASTFSEQSLLSPQDAWKTHSEAGRIYFDCRRKGITLRGAVDCFVAAMALENEAILLHDDDDFEKMKAVRALRTLRD